MQRFYPTALFVCILLLCQLTGHAQKNQPTIFAGQVINHVDYFWTDDKLLSDSIYDRPKFLERLYVNLQVAKEKFDMPIQALLTLPYRQADGNNPGPRNFVDYLQMPGTVLGMQPSYRKLRLNLGSHTANLSPLTAGDIAYSPLAGGIEFTPGRFCFKASYGITQRHIPTNLPFPGQQQRRLLAVQFGFGNDAKSHIMLNYMQAQNGNPTQLNHVLSLKYQLRGDEHLYWRGEIALSSPIVPPATALVPLDIGATENVIGVKFKHWDFAVGGKYVGPHYTTLAYFNQIRGYLDLTSTLNLKFFKSKIQLSGTGGVRRNGIAVPIEVSDHAIVNATGHYQFTKRWGFDAHYYNYAWQQPILVSPNQHTITPATIRQNNGSYGGSSTLRLGNRRSRILSANFSQDRYLLQYLNPPKGGTDVQARTIGANYQRINRHLNGFTLGGYEFRYQGMPPIWPFFQPRWNAYAGLQRHFFFTKLQVLAQFQYSCNDIAFPGDWNMLLATATASTKFFKKKLQYTAEANARWQMMPSGKSQLLFMRHSLQYQF